MDQNKDIRDKWQQEAVTAWNKAGGRGTVEAGTGTGKTYLGVKAAQLVEKHLGTMDVHVIVPTRLLKSQWEELIDEFNLTAEVFVINTYVKEDRQCDLLILDEMHNYAAPKFKKVLKTDCKYILGLTATLKRKDGLHVMLMQYAPRVYTLPIETARKLGFVSDYQVYNLGVEFTDPHDMEAYRKAHSTFTGLFQMFGYSLDTLMSCLKNDYNSLNYVASQNQITVKEVRQYTFMAMNAMRKRKEILYEAQSKIPVIKELVNQIPGQTLIFTQTIDSCEKIVEEIGSAKTYHSKIKGHKTRKGTRISASEVKRKIIAGFEKGKYQRLVGAKALNEGFSVNAVELAVFFSYTSDIRTFVQRMGRAVRFVEGKKAKIVSLYMKPFEFNGQTVHSQELKWLKEAQKANIGSVKWVNSIDEIIDEEPATQLTF